MFLAEASRTLNVSPEIAFDKLADFSSWKDWMPKSFQPMPSHIKTLAPGDRVKIRISGAPIASTIEITTCDRGREIGWRGGPRGLLHAHHRFLFEPHADGTFIRSVESWQGILTPFLRSIVKPSAERVGVQQLAGLARATTG